MSVVLLLHTLNDKTKCILVYPANTYLPYVISYIVLFLRQKCGMNFFTVNISTFAPPPPSLHWFRERVVGRRVGEGGYRDTESRYTRLIYVHIQYACIFVCILSTVYLYSVYILFIHMRIQLQPYITIK